MADTNRGRIAIVPEASFGVTPTDPVFQIMRLVNSGLQYTKNTTESNELDSSRMLTDIVEVGASSSGNLDFELSAGSYDQLIEAVLGGTRSTAISVAATTASIASSVLTATGEFANAEVGQWLLLQGWAEPENNGWKQITSVSGAPNAVTVSGVVDEADTASGTVKGQTMINGVTKRSFSIEESYLDVSQFRLFQGMRPSSMNLSISAGSILTGAFNFMGTTSEVASSATWLGSGSRTAANTNPVLNATANVGDIIVDGSVSTACFQSIDLSIDNSLREVSCLGNKFPGAINYGRQMVSGSFTKLFVDWTTYQKMLDHDDLTLSFGAYNSNGGIHIYLPRVKLGSDAVNLSGGNDSDVQENVDFSAIKSSDGTHQIRIDIA